MTSTSPAIFKGENIFLWITILFWTKDCAHLNGCCVMSMRGPLRDVISELSHCCINFKHGFIVPPVVIVPGSGLHQLNLSFPTVYTKNLCVAFMSIVGRKINNGMLGMVNQLETSSHSLLTKTNLSDTYSERRITVSPSGC